MGWMSPALAKLHLETQTHFQLRSLLTLDAIESYKRIGREQRICFERSGRRKGIEKLLRHSAKAGLVATVYRTREDLRSGKSLGQWFPPI
ncbi:hypothetical protein NY97_19540 [Xanthomonas citri pv. fuscans]|nr:hypothetical protein NY97_19540 [Xanthomonas citri pv. fuscans]